MMENITVSLMSCSVISSLDPFSSVAAVFIIDPFSSVASIFIICKLARDSVMLSSVLVGVLGEAGVFGELTTEKSFEIIMFIVQVR